MFNPLKGVSDLKKLRDEAMKVQKELAKIEVTSEQGRVKIVMSGDMKVKSLKINDEEAMDIRDAVNDAIEKAQKKSAQKMQEMGGGLQGLLGGK